MKKKVTVFMVLLLIFALYSNSIWANSINCYTLAQYTPKTYTMTWYVNSSLTTTEGGYAFNATATWNYAYTNCPFKFYKAGNSSGTIISQDGRSDVGKKNFYGTELPLSANAVNRLVCNSAYKVIEFDILLNTYHAWGNGYSNYYNDYKGIFTHEFGHTLGLADYNKKESSTTWEGDSDVPTMWYSNRATANRANLTYYFRDLSAGDIQGYKKSMARM